VLAIGPKVHGSNPVDDDRFLRAINIRSMTFFGKEVKPPVPYRKMLRHVKERYEYETDTSYVKFIGNFFAKFHLLRY
jgi:hypothetical protein